MKVTILIDNLSSGSLLSEWGLSIHIDYQGHQILLDLHGCEQPHECWKLSSGPLEKQQYS